MMAAVTAAEVVRPVLAAVQVQHLLEVAVVAAAAVAATAVDVVASTDNGVGVAAFESDRTKLHSKCIQHMRNKKTNKQQESREYLQFVVGSEIPHLLGKIEAFASAAGSSNKEVAAEGVETEEAEHDPLVHQEPCYCPPHH